MGVRNNLRGQRFGKLLAVQFIGINKHNRALWKCQCDCGNIKVFSANHLQRRQSTSCGCLRGPMHGFSSHPLYNTWKAMIRRCDCPTDKRWDAYGGKGIAVCDEWQQPETFIHWSQMNGWRPGLELHRINNNGNYEPKNCEWLTEDEHYKKHGRRLERDGVASGVLAFGS